tara:strand:+ start:177 stop:365 length:189 start_codon:yes stop_codon:yes gene_type:complete
MTEQSFSEDLSLGETIMVLKNLEQEFSESANEDSLEVMLHLIREMEIPVRLEGYPPLHEAQA